MQIHGGVSGHKISKKGLLLRFWLECLSTGVRYCFGQKEKDLARPVDELTVSRNEELDQES